MCFPDEGIVLLEQQDIPACNLTAIINAAKSSKLAIKLILDISYSDFSKYPLISKNIVLTNFSIFIHV